MSDNSSSDLPRRIAVFGASSQIGPLLITRLEAAGHVVFRIGRKSSVVEAGVTTHVFDEFSECLYPSIGSVDAVLSLAPLPSIDLVINIAHSLRAKRIIAFGSTGRFSKLHSTSSIEREFALQQIAAEERFSQRCKSLHIAWTLFRPTMIYGMGTDLNVAYIRKAIRKFGFFPIPVGAGGLRQPVHVDDLAIACVSALTHQTTLNKAYNLGGGEVISFPELVKRIFKAELRRPVLIPVPRQLFFILIALFKNLPKSAFLRKEMVERMFQDLIADNHEAFKDFGYSPRPFTLNSCSSI